ncbi:hypothetical protein LWI28_018723 [Acer negundo]|uniref:Phytocyanin domain-containing protein n=1 Tax=Acer negundo TaxID=4023 RepID=A0AAD5P0Z2_ACENE|nr:hypothetical protein LWI28_018723 [Acer negundo]
MGRIMSMSQLVMALALVASLLQGTAANDYTVGNATGWTNTQSADFYTSWANSFTFEVGDELVFNFGTGAHDVATVNKAAYDSCDKSNPINTTQSGPATVRLNNTGPHYFICTINQHCSQGQKLSVNVVNDNDNPSPPPPSPTGTTTPPAGTTTPTTGNNTTSPPPPSSASPRGVAFAFVFMSLAIAFFCC